MTFLETAALDDALNGFTNRLERIYSGEIFGLPTGFHDLDELVSAEPGALEVTGARPAMGKTALLLCEALYVAIVLHRPVLIFSLEMGKQELAMRAACILAGVDSRRLKRGDITEKDWAKLNHAYSRLSDAPLWIEESTTLNVKQMQARGQELKDTIGDLAMVGVDYIQLMTGERNEGRQVEVSDMSRGLKIMAKDLQVVVKALVQLNRELEHRPDKRPMMPDIRESGSIEQDADIVRFIYRDEVYNPDSEDKGVAEILVCKQRNGPIGMTKLAYLPHYTKFANMARVTDEGQ